MQVTGADADDVVQDVFLSVAAGIEKFQRPCQDSPSAAAGGETKGTFRGWLGAITRNKLCDFYERRQRQPAAQGGSDVHRLLPGIPPATLSDDAAHAAHVDDAH